MSDMWTSIFPVLFSRMAATLLLADQFWIFEAFYVAVFTVAFFHPNLISFDVAINLLRINGLEFPSILLSPALGLTLH